VTGSFAVPLRFALATAILFAQGGCSGNGPPSAPPSPAPSAQGPWVLSWADEFDTPGLPDPAKWDHEEGLIRNNEAQYYTRNRLENARVEEGRLVIEARKEAFGPASYTSASLITRGRAEFRYGRIEVRAELPRGRGLWPAIWTLGTNIGSVGWPACGEIDIMENVGFEPDRIHANVHTAAYNHVNGQGRGSSVVVPGVHDGFHVYAIEWAPERIDFFVDEVHYFTYRKESADPRVWPFDLPQYLILNVAVGGAWGGQRGIDDSVFPQRLLVDYARVYVRS
jgi:beta-glucanase (GH16 family)